MNDFVPRDQSERDAALDPDRSVIVQAPAGSGKTGLLAQRFLRLLAEVEQPEEIVAITFTRKAAAEMRERVLGAIERAANAGEECANANERRTLELARAALQADRERDWRLLDNPNRLRVTTIDSFNAMLTRQMPLGSGFGQQPAISEDQGALCRAAVERLLESLEARAEPGASLRLLLAHLDNRVDELGELLAGMLAKRDLWLRHLEFGGLDREVLEGALNREVEHVLAALDSLMPESVRHDVLALAKRCATYLDASDKWNGTNAFLRELAALEQFPRARGEQLDHWRLLGQFLLTNGGEVRKPRGLNVALGFPAASDKGLLPEEKQARDEHKAAMSALLGDLEDTPACVALLKKLAVLPPAHYADAQWELLAALNSLMPFAVLALQEVFRDRGEVDFPELAIRARDALGSASEPTNLALRLDCQVRHLLVDEFQDTSHSQIDLLLRLVRDWQPGDGRSLFVVGDPMQSIYQFREAEVGHFLAVRENGLGELPLQPLRLSANFRSQAGVVEWVNDAFRTIFPSRDDIANGAIAFEASEAVKPALDGQAVQVHAFAQGDNAGEGERVLELVRDALADPDNHGTAILVRGRAHLAAILPLLRANRIPFQAVELESLESVPVVQDLLALTRVLLNPADSTALFAVLRAPWCGLALRDLQRLVAEDAPPFMRLGEAVLDGESLRRLHKVRETLDAAEHRRGRIGLRERVETAWLQLGGPAALREPGELEDARLFLELLQQLEHAGELDDVNLFDERLRQLYAAPDPAAGDALQVMTLHKAKGLQFDTVIIPALDQVTGRKDRLLFQWIERVQPDGSERVLLGPLKSRDDEEGGAIYRFIERLKEEKELLERARLLYVGVTRAKRRVHLLGKARFAFRNGVASLSPPRPGSLLDVLWPLAEVREAFEALPLPDEKPQAATIATANAPLRRLPADWRPPALPPGPGIRVAPRGTASEGEQVPYEWAGDRVRHVGTLVHRCLERMARDGLAAWSAARVQALPVERQLAAMGLPEAECAAAASDVRDALACVLESRHARWIFDTHLDARSEWALGGLDGGERVSVSIDRSFVDADGTRWIIDYKTSRHEGSNLEEFLAEQQRRYRSQLARYARLVQALDKRPVKVALYFPLQDVLTSWEPERE